jgi:hypothetical protein
MNVAVRQKKSAVRPTDLRSVARLRVPVCVSPADAQETGQQTYKKRKVMTVQAVR